MPFSLLRLMIHGNCAVKAKVAQTHCAETNVTRNVIFFFFSKCLCAHARAPSNKHEDLENPDINKKKHDSVGSIETSEMVCVMEVLKNTSYRLY